MQEVKSLKYFGDKLCSTPEESVHQTVLGRIGIAKRAIFEIRAVIEDKRAKQVGGFNIALEIWDAAIIPMLLNNAESWTSISKRTHKVLDDLFNLFYRTMFRIGYGCPKVNFYWQCATLTVDSYILQKKLLFIFHLANLPRNSLAFEVFTIQETESLGGLLSENEEHLEKLNFSSTRNMNKWQFRKLVKNYIVQRQKESLLQSMKSYKKISYDKCSMEEFERKSYFYEMNLNQIRDRFRISSSMVDVRANFPNKYRHESLDCPSCRETNKQTDSQSVGPIHSQSHLLESCPAFSDL